MVVALRQGLQLIQILSYVRKICQQGQRWEATQDPYLQGSSETTGKLTPPPAYELVPKPSCPIPWG